MSRPLILIIVALTLLTTGYFWQRQREAAYRQEMLGNFSAIAKAVVDHRAKRREFIDRYSAKQIEKPGSTEGDEEGTRLDNEHIKLRFDFYALETAIKKQGDGSLPMWVKDDRLWQELDRHFKQTR